MAEFKMFSAGVTDGSHLNMRVRKLENFGWKNSFEKEQEPGKSIGSPWNVRTPSFRYIGYEAPITSFTGFIDLSQTALGSDAGGSLYVTLPRLGSITLAGSVYVLFPMFGDFIGSPFSAPATGSIPCVIDQVGISSDLTYTKGSEYIVNYTMQLTFISGPV